jgi:hypothetical protein
MLLLTAAIPLLVTRLQVKENTMSTLLLSTKDQQLLINSFKNEMRALLREYQQSKPLTAEHISRFTTKAARLEKEISKLAQHPGVFDEKNFDQISKYCRTLIHCQRKRMSVASQEKYSSSYLHYGTCFSMHQAA